MDNSEDDRDDLHGISPMNNGMNNAINNGIDLTAHSSGEPNVITKSTTQIVVTKPLGMDSMEDLNGMTRSQTQPSGYQPSGYQVSHQSPSKSVSSPDHPTMNMMDSAGSIMLSNIHEDVNEQPQMMSGATPLQIPTVDPTTKSNSVSFNLNSNTTAIIRGRHGSRHGQHQHSNSLDPSLLSNLHHQRRSRSPSRESVRDVSADEEAFHLFLGTTGGNQSYEDDGDTSANDETTKMMNNFRTITHSTENDNISMAMESSGEEEIEHFKEHFDAAIAASGGRKRTGTGTGSRSNDRSADRSNDRSGNRSDNRSDNRSENRSDNRSENRSDYRSDDKSDNSKGNVGDIGIQREFRKMSSMDVPMQRRGHRSRKTTEDEDLYGHHHRLTASYDVTAIGGAESVFRFELENAEDAESAMCGIMRLVWGERIQKVIGKEARHSQDDDIFFILSNVWYELCCVLVFVG